MKRYIKSDINSYSYTGSGFADDSETVFRWDADDEGSTFVTLVLDGRTWYVDYMRDAFSTRENLDYWTYKLADVDQAIAKVNECLELAGADEYIDKSDLDQWASRLDVSPKYRDIDDLIAWRSGKGNY
jgi:hypothetical protein